MTAPPMSEKDAKLGQKLGQLQPFAAVFAHECTGQPASCGPTVLTPVLPRARGQARLYRHLRALQPAPAIVSVGHR